MPAFYLVPHSSQPDSPFVVLIPTISPRTEHYYAPRAFPPHACMASTRGTGERRCNDVYRKMRAVGDKDMFKSAQKGYRTKRLVC